MYTNKDFYLSAYLMTKCHKLISNTREGGITTFEFEDNDMLRQDIRNFYSMQDLIEPMSYVQNIRSLKSIIHSNSI